MGDPRCAGLLCGVRADPHATDGRLPALWVRSGRDREGGAMTWRGIALIALLVISGFALAGLGLYLDPVQLASRGGF